MLFRGLNLIKSRGQWSPELEDKRVRASMPPSTLDRDRSWSTDEQSAAFSPFRLAANEIERLQKEARELARRKAEEEQVEEKEAREGIVFLSHLLENSSLRFVCAVVKLSDALEQLKTKRNELEAAREATIRQMQQIHAQITVRRTEGETCLFFAADLFGSFRSRSMETEISD